MFRFIVAFVALLALTLAPARAHDIPVDATVQAFVKPAGDRLHLIIRVPVETVQGRLPEAAGQWIASFVRIYEDDQPLTTHPQVVAAGLSQSSDRSFASYDEALAHVTAPALDNGGSMLDVLLDYPIHSDRAEFSLDPALDNLAARVNIVLRFLPPGGAVRAYEFSGDPGLIHLDPSWHEAALSFIRMGFDHILDGTDHLLFLLCLVIPFRHFRALIPVVTAFTVAHSITLIASAYGMAPNAGWFPPLIETLIALSIFYMALENIVGSTNLNRRWMMAFGFGLVHGFGFSFALRQSLQFAGGHMLSSLLSFNIGVELGQLLVLLLVIPILNFFFHRVVKERMGTIILSAIVAHTAWHWMLDRFEAMRRIPFRWPEVTSDLITIALRWMIVAVTVAGAAWLIDGVLRKRAKRMIVQ